MSKRVQAKYHEIIIMPSLYVYGRQVGVLSAYVEGKSGQIVINRGLVCTSRG